MYQPPIIDLQAITLDREPRRPRLLRRTVVIAAAAFLLPLGLYFTVAPRHKAQRQAAARAAVERQAFSRNPVHLPANPKATGRPVYPYSVIRSPHLH